MNFLDKGFYTPQTVMLQSIRQWVLNSEADCRIALSVDNNPTLDAIMLERWPHLRIDHAVQPQYDAQDLSSILADKYDLVYSHQVLEHLPRPWKAAREFLRVTKPGGLNLHTTCAFNPKHGPPAFGDYYRFYPEGLKELFHEFGCEIADGWGNRQAIIYNLTVDDGHGPLGGRRFHPHVCLENDHVFPWVTWLIASKPQGASQQPDRDAIYRDSNGIRFILREFEEPIRERLIQRDCDVDVFKLFTLLLRDGDTAFDVGAHVGRYSVTMSRLVGTAGRVHAFEPVAANYFNLMATIALNTCGNVVLNQYAASDENGPRMINIYPPAYSSWSTFGEYVMYGPDGQRVDSERQEEVQQIRIDDYLLANGVPSVRVMKIDVEGFEMQVLHGAEKSISAGRIDSVVFEYSKVPFAATGISFDTMLTFFKERDFNVYSLVPSSSLLFELIENEPDQAMTNLLAVRSNSDIVLPLSAE